MRFFNRSIFLWVGFFAATLSPNYIFSKDNNNIECFKHNIKLQLFDVFGLPIDGTEFWVTLDIKKHGNLVTIQFPVINFQTGPVSPEDPYPFFPGGYIYTVDGYLPESVRPNDLVYRSLVAASNNGTSQPFTFVQPPETLPIPPAGYILSLTNAGGIAIACAGIFGNIIPAGPQILMPTKITYIVKPKVALCKNYIIDPGFTNTTQFTNPDAANVGLRDSHVNDAFDSVVAWAWQSNANIADKTNGITNLFVAVGTINSDGTLSIGAPVQLTDFPSEVGIFDTAIAINRTNKNNIVVSYALGNYNTVILSPCRAVSFDGGKTWPTPFDGVNSVPLNGFTNLQPTGVPSSVGDNRGVASDKFGNIWYSTTNRNNNLGHLINQPTFWISTDGGDTFSVAYTVPTPSFGTLYDFPEFCFGGDGLGNYGLWFVVDFESEFTLDCNPAVGFIAINGFGSYDTTNPAPVNLSTLSNVNIGACITASADGRVWTFGYPGGFGPSFIPSPFSGIAPVRTIFKSPGALDQNYAGPWDFAIINLVPDILGLPFYESQPVRGYFNSAQTNIYDDQRQALYQLSIGNFPDFSQNMRLYFAISRDNAQTWSDPIDIATTDFANRGFQSMALDPVTGNLVFGWYDGRNDPTLQSIQYFGAILPAAQLDALVNSIPLSNPLYNLGSAA